MPFIWTHWKWNTIFSVPTTDEMILAQGCVALISTLSIFLILLWSITSFRHDYTLTATQPMRYSCLISMFFFFIQSLLQLTGINNAFVNISKLSCQIFYPSQLLAYNFAKISMFWLFSFRLQLLCDSNAKLKISSLFLNFYRISCLIIPTLLWIAWIYFTFPDTKPHNTVTSNNKYQDCFPETFPHSFIAENIVGGGVVLADIFYSLTALIAFITKCYQVTMLITNKKKQKQNGSSKTKSTFQSINVYHVIQNSPSIRLSLTPHTLSPKSNIIINNIFEDDKSKEKDKEKEKEEISHSRLMKKLENMAIVIKKSTFLTTIAMLSTMFYTIGGAYILRQIGFFLCFDGVISSLCMACLFRFGDDLYGFMFSKMEILLFWIFYIISCCCCICCKYCDYDYDDDNIEYIPKHYSPKQNSMKSLKCDEEDKRSLVYNAEHINTNIAHLNNALCKVETNQSNLNVKINTSMSMNSTNSQIRAETNAFQTSISDLQQSTKTDATVT